jgi:hypothetical protein
MTPTQLSLRHLRAEGWMVDVCERWVPSPNGAVRKDLFGMLDLIAVRDTEAMGIQTTSAGNVASRILKMTDEDHLPKMLRLKAAGWLVVVHGWRKSTRDGHACTHDSKARCACIWTLHRDEHL